MVQEVLMRGLSECTLGLKTCTTCRARMNLHPAVGARGPGHGVPPALSEPWRPPAPPTGEKAEQQDGVASHGFLPHRSTTLLNMATTHRHL